VLALVLGAAICNGCSAALSTKSSGPTAPRAFSTQIAVHDEALTLHLSSPQTPATDRMPLVLYASGDGGWFGAAVGMFRTIAGRGVPVVGFSTKAFMRIERRWSRPLRVAHIAEGYQAIIDAARAQLRVPRDCPVVLTGWSRGASLGVLVASSHEVDPAVIGLVAVGLAADERLDIDGDSDDDEARNPEVRDGLNDDPDGGAIAMYPLLSRIAPRRAVVIQASGDGYLSAARARDLFGSDSPMKRLVGIDARNHRFSGGESEFVAALVEAVNWVASSAEDSK
jgi:Bacterial virulence protein (VirJ)